MAPTPRGQCGVIPPKPKPDEKVKKDKELPHDYRKIVKESLKNVNLKIDGRQSKISLI